MDREISRPEALAAAIAKHPLVGALLELAPVVGGAAHTALDAWGTKIEQRRREQLFAELARRDITIDEKRIREDSFAENYFALDAAITSNSRRRKIELFANLLHNYAKLGSDVGHDEFPDLLDLLDTLNDHELCLLTVLAKHAQENADHQDMIHHDALAKRVRENCGLELRQAQAVAMALMRTGLYFVTSAPLLGNVSPQYWRFAQVVLAEVNTAIG